MTTYLVHGFRRGNSSSGTVCMLVDAEWSPYVDQGPHEVAQRIAGDEFMFHASQNVFVSVPEDCKNTLFTSDAELYARVPELDWRRRKRGKARRSTGNK